MGVLQAHGLNMSQIKNWNRIATIKNFSIAEHYYDQEKETIESFSHSHSEYEFIIPIETIPLLIYDKANYIGEVGYIYPVNPLVTHGIVFPLEKSHCIDITIDKQYLDSIKEKMGYNEKYFFTRFQLPPTFLEVIYEFLNEVTKESYNSFKVENVANIIISLLIEEGLSSGEDNRRPEKKYRKNIKNMIEYMYRHYSDPNLDINVLAQMSGYSVSYFSKAFKAYMRDTPIIHLNKLRISEAKSILMQENLPFSIIAARCGYSNLSSFTEAFKRVTGYTPTEYKNKYIKK